MKKEIIDEKYIENRFKKFVYTSLQNCVKDYYKKEETQNVFDDGDDDDEYVSVSNRPNTTLWIILGVLSSLFCCFITGIVTTVFAIKANNAANKGKYITASGYIDKAAGWFAFTVIIGVIEIVIGIVAAIFLK